MLSIVTLTLLAGPALLSAQEGFQSPDPPEAMGERAQWLAEQFTDEPQPPDSAFADAFLQQVPKSRLVQVLQQYHAGLGSVTTVEPLGPLTDDLWIFRFHFERGRAALIQLGIASDAPHVVESILVGQDTGPGGG